MLAAKTMFDYALSLSEPSIEEITAYAYNNLDDLVVAYADFLDWDDKEARIDGFKEDWSNQAGLMFPFDHVKLDSSDIWVARRAAVFLSLNDDINWTIENTAHEFSHALRYSDGAGRISWIEEGVAEYHAGRVLAELGFAEYDDFRHSSIQHSHLFKELEDLLGLRREEEVNLNYSEGFLAAELLASIAGEKALFDYNARVGRTTSSTSGTWYTPFKSAFGMSPIQFYEIFNAHWDAGFPKLELPEFPLSVQPPQASSSESASCSNGVAVPNPQSNPDLISDCEVLLELRDKLAGNGELNWTTNFSMLDWDGVKVSGSPSRVTELQLNVKRLTGQIPSELGKLSSLTNLSLGGNELTGEIPPELSNLANLTRLWLGDNQLTGEIPPELGRISNLRWLWLGFNSLTGEIPSELSNLRELKEWSFRYNDLSGEIPSELGNLVDVKFLRLEGNNFTGCVPRSLLGNSDNDLTRLGIKACEHTASVSNACSNGIAVPEPQSNPGLVSDCELLLSVLDTLDPTDQLDWWAERDMKDWWGIIIDESTNRVTGVGPIHRGLSGQIPVELASMSNLTDLSFGYNQLTGEVPPELGKLSNLEFLYLGGNHFTGEIPPGLGMLSNLERLILSNNQLTGEIPVELTKLSNLRSLGLGDNQLTGEIPMEFARLEKLELVDLRNNMFVGEIPVELGSLEHLEQLQLQGNQLTGCIPSSLKDINGDLHDIGLEFCGDSSDQP